MKNKNKTNLLIETLSCSKVMSCDIVKHHMILKKSDPLLDSHVLMLISLFLFLYKHFERKTTFFTPIFTFTFTFTIQIL